MKTSFAPVPQPCPRPATATSFRAELKKLFAQLVTLR